MVPLGNKAKPSEESTSEAFSERFMGFAKDILEFELNHMSDDKDLPVASFGSLKSLQSKSILSVVKPEAKLEPPDSKPPKAEVTDLLSRKNPGGENT